MLAEATDRPDLSTFGTEVMGTISNKTADMQYQLWPLVHSGFIRVRCSDLLLAQLNAQCDAMYVERSCSSHALFLQGEMKEGKQLTIHVLIPEFAALLLSCATALGRALLGDDTESVEYVVDSAWSVHQLAGDYNPVHFHNNTRSDFGFSSFLHLQLPPQLNSRHKSGASREQEGVTSFLWKADSGSVGEGLECPGAHACELEEGYLYVFPQWVQHSVWPFRGPGERRTVAANIARLSGPSARKGCGAA
ncbi:unnamed protein product [Polarella glacialis]|uniref:JmjC domain-containing protein n=1 Tax=Polarella glacialis TaxID=89957 RepID=A0A813J3A4_POLGL|nr:unnamed protein product [Polarella glacialis]